MSAPFALDQQGFQLRDRLEVLRPACGSFGANERLQPKDQDLPPEDWQLDGMGNNLLVGPTAGHLSEQIDVPDGGRQGEVQASADGSRIESKGKTGRRSSRIRDLGCEGRREPVDVVGGTPIEEVDVLGQARGSMCLGSQSSDDDSLDTKVREHSDDASEVSGHDRTLRRGAFLQRGPPRPRSCASVLRESASSSVVAAFYRRPACKPR